MFTTWAPWLRSLISALKYSSCVFKEWASGTYTEIIVQRQKKFTFPLICHFLLLIKQDIPSSQGYLSATACWAPFAIHCPQDTRCVCVCVCVKICCHSAKVPGLAYLLAEGRQKASRGKADCLGKKRTTSLNKEMTKGGRHTHKHSPGILRGSFVLGQSSVIKVGSHNHFDCSEKSSLAKIPRGQIIRFSYQTRWARLLPGVFAQVCVLFAEQYEIKKLEMQKDIKTLWCTQVDTQTAMFVEQLLPRHQIPLLLLIPCRRPNETVLHTVRFKGVCVCVL